jgi:hypothetical protein
MNDEIEAAAKRCAEDAARMWEIVTMTTLLEAIRAPGVAPRLIEPGSDVTGTSSRRFDPPIETQHGKRRQASMKFR